MKRTILVIALIALVAVAVFGGQALAGKPAKPTGSAVGMETGEASVPPVSSGQATVSVNYPQVRHVSLTVNIIGLQAPDLVNIVTWMPSSVSGYLDKISAYQISTYEFDSDNFRIDIDDQGGTATTVSYYVTTTYERLYCDRVRG